MASYTLETVKETPDASHFMTKVVPADLQRTLQSVFLDALNEQKGIGNKPTGISIDGGRGDLLNVKRRAQAFFTNEGRIAEALREAWRMLVEKTRIRDPSGYRWQQKGKAAPGLARGSYGLYHNGIKVGDESGIDTLAKKMAIGDWASIVGPGTAYGRKMYWLPTTGRKIRKKRGQVIQRAKKGVERVVLYTTYTEPIHRFVKRKLRLRFRDLVISDKWVPLFHFHAGLSTDKPRFGERWPAISIAVRRGGGM